MRRETPRFADHFSTVATGYARFRPRYPAALFDWLAAAAPGRRLAWDCGTGNGQAAVGLARRFAHVVATDASSSQLAHAAPHPRVVYRLAPAEASGLHDHCCELVSAAQALHWFDRPAFFAEARRVLVPRGVIAIWGYLRLHTGEAALDAELERFHDEIVGAYWPPGRETVLDGYRTVEFPFEELSPPPFAIAARLTLEQLGGYLGSWSATDRFRKERGEDPVPGFVATLAGAWGESRDVTWPLALRVGRA